MTEPVAYLHKSNKNKKEVYLEFGVSDNKNFDSIPLYTSEQLHQRVKMTRTEFDEWHKLVEEVADLYTAVTEICDISPYPNLYCRFFDLQNEDTDKTRKTQVEFATLWGIFDEFNPEETIEIVPDIKKWFVRSKEKNGNRYLYLKKPDDFVTPWYTVFKDLARHFDTEEEAELWNNPQTEAVQLPVEEK